MSRKVQIISEDSHRDFPPERWVHRVPAKWRERAPRRIKLANGDDAFIIADAAPRIDVGRMGVENFRVHTVLILLAKALRGQAGLFCPSDFSSLFLSSPTLRQRAPRAASGKNC